MIALVVVIAKRMGVPAPILLVPAGLGLALVPGLPHVALDPHLVMTLLLPPLVYAAAIETSWPDFRANLRPIAIMAASCSRRRGSPRWPTTRSARRGPLGAC